MRQSSGSSSDRNKGLCTFYLRLHNIKSLRPLFIFVRTRGPMLNTMKAYLAGTALAILIAVAGYFAFTGFSFVSDASEEKDLWGGYKPGSVYSLKTYVFMLQLSSDNRAWYAASPEGKYDLIKDNTSRFYSVPFSIEEYRESQEGSLKIVSGRRYHLNTQVIGILKRGTRILCKKIEKEVSFSMFFGLRRSITVFAEILDGPYSGNVIDISDLSILKQSRPVINICPFDPNPTLLEPVTAERL